MSNQSTSINLASFRVVEYANGEPFPHHNTDNISFFVPAVAGDKPCVYLVEFLDAMGDSFSFGHPGDLADQFHEGCGDEFILPYLPELVAIAQRLLVNNPRSGNGIPRCVTFVTAWAYEAGKSADTHDGPGEWYVNCDLIGLVDCSRLKEITTVEEVTQ